MKNKIVLLAAVFSFAATASPYNIQIPTDPKATYTILEKGNQDKLRTIVTKREGRSGVTYSKRLFNCSSNEVKYLGTGETVEQMENSKPDPKMSLIVGNSIAYYLSIEACK